MPYIQKITNSIGPRWVQSLFFLWLIALPFGTFLGSFSLGFFTIYPSLILFVILFVLVSPSIFIWDKRLIYFGLFLLFWLIYSVCAPFIMNFEPNLNWRFDVRSLFMQFMCFVVLTGSFYKLGKLNFSRALEQGLFFFLVVLVFAGILEYYTGIHLRGNFTNKLLIENSVSQIFYAPIFIYDNPNDYLVYYFGILSLYLLFANPAFWKTIFFIGLGFMFAETAGARVAMITSIVMGTVYILFHLRARSLPYKIISVAVAMVILCFVLNPTFIGPKYSKGEFTTSNNYVEYPKSQVGELSSNNVRKNLLLNGIDFVRESPIMGIGPGQFRERHQNGSINHNTGTVVGPHNYLVEIISQYGIFAWFYLTVLGFIFILEIRQVIKSNEWSWRFMLLPIFGMLSIAPSSFLYLDVNWIIVSISLLFFIEFNTQRSE